MARGKKVAVLFLVAPAMLASSLTARAQIPSIDHYVCYSVGLAKTTPAQSKFVNPTGGVSLQDQFGTIQQDLKGPKSLCTPVLKKNGNTVSVAPTIHHVQYAVKATKTPTPQPKFLPRTKTFVEQFGTLVLTASKPDDLLTPTNKNVSTTPPPSAPPNTTNHFQCYKAAVARTVPPQPKFSPIPGVTVQDQFGTFKYDLRSPKRICAPVNKNNEDPSAVSDPGHLVCFQAGYTKMIPPQPKFTGPVVAIRDQFGPRVLQVKKVREICLPASKTAYTTTTTTTTTSTTSTTVCDAEGSGVAGITAAHNTVRANASPTPSPALPPFCYSASVASTAQGWANMCNFSHNPNLHSLGLGENIYAYCPAGSRPVTDAVNGPSGWATEASNYNESTNTCAGCDLYDSCGINASCPTCCLHYTQLVWRSTQRLGCGVTNCSSASAPSFCSGNTWTIIVCDYKPAGNVKPQKPY